MNLSHILTALLAGAVVCLISGAEASPRFQAPMFSPLPLQAGLKCGLVNGQLVCGNTNGSGKHHDDDDDQQGNDDDHHKKKKTPMMILGCQNAPSKGQILVGAARADLSMSAKN